jgi:iron complex transport system substrate-binding protein
MKRILAGLVTAALALGIVSGCGSKDKTNTDISSTAGASSSSSVTSSGALTASAGNNATPAKAAFPRTYKDMLGNEVVIAAKPQRVAVAFFHFLEPWFAMGFTPIAGDSSDMLLDGFLSLQPFAKDKAQVTDLGSPMNLERLLEVKPDLIISATPYNDKIHDQLKQIAPVVVFTNELDWKTRMTEFSKLVGEEEAAAAKSVEIETLITSAKDKLAGFKDKTVAFFGLNNKGTYTAYGINRCTAFYDANVGLGLTPPKGYPALHGENNIYTLEGLSGMNPDYLFIWDDATSSTEENALAELKNNPVWNTMTAVKNGHVFTLDRSAFSGGPLGVEYGVKSVLEKMTK